MRCAPRRRRATRSTASAGSRPGQAALAAELPALAPGYAQTPAAALALLAALERRGALRRTAAVAARIRQPLAGG
ncbi:MAG: hypothetical protein MZW92_23045 [Comamonadaceae bacterium]|nr:hypothetical protein [Comamonadaceae bacterium]